MIALYVLVLALLWLGVAVVTYRLWNSYFVPERGISRLARIIGGWMLLLGWMLVPWYLLYGRTAMLDAEVRELCARDGGVRVYETVRLPKERFDKWGMVKPYDPTQKENALGSEYTYKTEEYFFRKGNPSIVRYHHQVFRRSDGKLLGETTSYGRGGGDMPGPWELSNYHCPPTSVSSEIALFKRIFIPSMEGK